MNQSNGRRSDFNQMKYTHDKHVHSHQPEFTITNQKPISELLHRTCKNHTIPKLNSDSPYDFDHPWIQFQNLTVGDVQQA